MDCKENRVLNFSDVVDKGPDEAWDALVAADKTRDLDEFREACRAQCTTMISIDNILQALQIYIKAVPKTSYEELESAFRHHNFLTYLIALVSELIRALQNPFLFVC